MCEIDVTHNELEGMNEWMFFGGGMKINSQKNHESRAKIVVWLQYVYALCICTHFRQKLLKHFEFMFMVGWALCTQYNLDESIQDCSKYVDAFEWVCYYVYYAGI